MILASKVVGQTQRIAEANKFFFERLFEAGIFTKNSTKIRQTIYFQNAYSILSRIIP